MHTNPAQPPSTPNDYRDREVRIQPILLFGVILFSIIAIVFVALWMGFRVLSSIEAKTTPEPTPLSMERQLPPAPLLQVTAQGDLSELRVYEDALIHRYVILDTTGGVVRIPVDRAMELLAQRGLPHREAVAKETTK